MPFAGEMNASRRHGSKSTQGKMLALFEAQNETLARQAAALEPLGKLVEPGAAAKGPRNGG